MVFICKVVPETIFLKIIWRCNQGVGMFVKQYSSGEEMEGSRQCVEASINHHSAVNNNSWLKISMCSDLSAIA